MPNLDVVDVVGGVEGLRGTTVARRDRIGRHELRLDPSEDRKDFWEVRGYSNSAEPGSTIAT
jgi:hypothetical protein